MDIEWVRIRSWHAIRTHTRVPGGVVTVCGRNVVDARMSDVLPAGRSCETCLRIVTRKADR